MWGMCMRFSPGNRVGGGMQRCAHFILMWSLDYLDVCVYVCVRVGLCVWVFVCGCV